MIPKSASLFLIQLFTHRPDGFIHLDFSRTPLKVYWLGTDSQIEFPSRWIWFDGGIQRSRRRFVRNASAWGCQDSPTRKTPRDRSTTWIPSLKGMVALGQVQRGVQSYQLVYLGYVGLILPNLSQVAYPLNGGFYSRTCIWWLFFRSWESFATV